MAESRFRGTLLQPNTPQWEEFRRRESSGRSMFATELVQLVGLGYGSMRQAYRSACGQRDEHSAWLLSLFQRGHDSEAAVVRMVRGVVQERGVAALVVHGVGPIAGRPPHFGDLFASPDIVLLAEPDHRDAILIECKYTERGVDLRDRDLPELGHLLQVCVQLTVMGPIVGQAFIMYTHASGDQRVFRVRESTDYCYPLAVTLVRRAYDRAVAMRARARTTRQPEREWIEAFRRVRDTVQADVAQYRRSFVTEDDGEGCIPTLAFKQS